MDLMYSYIIVCGILYPVFANPSPITFDEKKLTNEINLQTFQLSLLSIEEKLRNLESFVVVQCGTRMNGKMDYYGRKIDNIEKTLSKMEMQSKLELEKISEIVGSKNFKEDIGNERIIRNIDITHEKLNHKLTAIEQRADLSTIKMKNIGEMLMSKLEKVEETFMIRDSDVEAELTEVVTAIDDLKTGYTSSEGNMVNVITQSSEKLLKNTEILLNQQNVRIETALNSTAENIIKNIEGIQETTQQVLTLIENATEFMGASKEELFDNLNEYANKIIDIHVDLWEKTDTINSKMHQLSNTANLSRNEQQNGLRGLTVQLGRLSGKPQMQSDSYDHSKIDELEQKIEEKFQHILLTQNMFLESCHRVQMDEAQIETQIGAVLNKLIDVFENKTSVTIHDIHRIEHSIYTHDFNTKQCLQNTLSNMKDLFDTVRKEHVKITQNINEQKEGIRNVNSLLQSVAHSQQKPIAQSILDTVKVLEKQIAANSNTLDAQSNITKLLLRINLQQNFNFSTFMSDIANDLNIIKDNTNTWFLKKEEINYLINNYKDRVRPNIAELITHIFVKKPDTSVLNKKHFTITRSELEILMESLNNTEKIDNYTYSIQNQDELQIINCLQHYIDLIDVRYNSDELLNCTVIKTPNKDKARNCLPNYLDIIDVRFNRENFTNCIDADEDTQIKFEVPFLNETITSTKTPKAMAQQVVEDWEEYPENTTPSEEEGEITFQNYDRTDS